MGTRLPSSGEVLIIRPAGKKGQPPHRSNRVNPFTPGGPARKPGHSKAGSVRSAVQSECSLTLKRSQIVISRVFKEPY
jgi:hypothetical protein